MTPAEVQNTVSSIIDLARKMGYDSGYLSLQGKELALFKPSELKPGQIFFFRFGDSHIRNGLTAAEWDTLTKNVLDYLEGEKPCQKNLIP